MAIESITILRDKDGNPVPQYYNPETGVMEALTGYNGANSFHEQGTIVVDIFNGTGNVTKTYPQNCQSFTIFNEGNTDITVSIAGFTFTVPPDRAVEEKFPLFTTFTLTTTSSYFVTVRA